MLFNFYPFLFICHMLFPGNLTCKGLGGGVKSSACPALCCWGPKHRNEPKCKTLFKQEVKVQWGDDVMCTLFWRILLRIWTHLLLGPRIEILVVSVIRFWVWPGPEVDTTSSRWQPPGPPCGYRSRVSGSLQRCWRTCFCDQCTGSKLSKWVVP